MIKLAIVGTGYIADYHVRGILATPGAGITGVLSRTRANAEKFAAKYDVDRVYDTLPELAADPSVDGVIIATPNVFHAPYAIECLKNGKDVFIEKPLAMGVEEGLHIKEAAEKNNRLVIVGHMWRFDTDVNYVKKAVEEGKLGNVFKTKGYGIHENWGPSGWFVQKKQAGGGALADMGVHAIDTGRYLLGDPWPVKVYARLHTHFGAYDVDDTGTLIITWENGADSIVESGWWQPHMDGPEAGTGLYGTKGFAGLFPTFLKLTTGVESSERIEPDLPERSEHCDQRIYTAQMEYFVQCIRSRTVPVPGVEEGLTVLRILEAAYTSAATGNAVSIGS